MDNQQISEAERNAIRAYLGRAEVRLSTLHRIATAFISGAGLLLLVPIFLRDVVEGLLRIYLDLVHQLPLGNLWLNIVLLVMLAYPFVLSLTIPLYGVYLMLKDTVQFYFTLYAPGMPAEILNPTFSLNALMLSHDEAPVGKAAAQQLQYQQAYLNYMMSFSDKRRAQYFDVLVKDTNGEIIPPTRRNMTSNTLTASDVQRMNTAFGITRGLDRTLIEEVALIELTLARNILYLRRLLLRYVKTLLMFIWTAVVSFVVLPFLQDERLPIYWILILFYFVWALIAIRLIRLPLAWMYRHLQGEVRPEHIDAQLSQLEQRVRPFLYLALLASAIASLLLVIPMK